MIDFHTHILPNVDDGAKDIQESIHLLEEAERVGFGEIVLTSHYIENYYEVSGEARIKLLNRIKDNLKDYHIDIKLVLGNEIYISDNIIDLIKSKRAYTINNTKYVLFELPFNIKPLNLYDVIYKMLQNNLVPILAHPERYAFIQQNPNIIYDLIQNGVLIQCNYGSFIGQYGKKAQIIVKKLLKSDMIHLLGTDVHKRNTIYLKIPKILSNIEKIIGKEKLELIIQTNPKLILENKDIRINQPKKLKLSVIENFIMRVN